MDRNTRQDHFLSGKSIFVIGAGLSGSAFVASLRTVWDEDSPLPHISVFDRDPRSTFVRRGGYSLSLVGHSISGGLLPLKKMGILDSVMHNSIVGVGGNGVFKIWTRGWKELIGFTRPPLDGIPTSSLRIARESIRQVLLEAAQLDREGAVRWDTRCVSVAKLPTGRVAVKVVRGETGTTETLESDFVIVADGARSKIRAVLRPHDELQYTGAVMRTGVSRFANSLPKEIGKDWGFVLSKTGVSCFVSPVGERDVQWAVGHFEDKISAKDEAFPDGHKIIERAAELGSHIQEPFSTIISQTDPDTAMCINAHDKLPFRHSANANLPVVFIGDSNHPLSPFAGYGANLGLNDAWDLAEQLVKAASLTQAIEAYDEISFPRADEVVRGARRRLRAGHSTGIRYFIFVFMLACARVFSHIFGR